MLLTNHIVNPVNDLLAIEVMDQPGAGGANHVYEITNAGKPICIINFQNGPINEHGINGLTHEALLAIIEHRLQGFQKGKFACEDNAVALGFVQAALGTLKKRTEARMKRGVEGQTKV